MASQPSRYVHLAGVGTQALLGLQVTKWPLVEGYTQSVVVVVVNHWCMSSRHVRKKQSFRYGKDRGNSLPLQGIHMEGRYVQEVGTALSVSALRSLAVERVWLLCRSFLVVNDRSYLTGSLVGFRGSLEVKHLAQSMLSTSAQKGAGRRSKRDQD